METVNSEAAKPHRRRRHATIKNDGIICYGGTQNVTNCAIGPGASMSIVHLAWENDTPTAEGEGVTNEG